MFISISETVSDRATKTLVLNIQEDSTIISPKEFTQRVEYFLCDAGLKIQNFCKECMSSLALETPRNFTFFESHFLNEYFTQ